MRPIWWCLLDQYVTRVQKQTCCRLTISPCCYLWSTKVILPSTESREMNSLLLLPMMSEQFGALVTWSRPMATRQQWLFPWSSSCWTPAAHTDRQAWLHAGEGNTWHPDITQIGRHDYMQARGIHGTQISCMCCWMLTKRIYTCTQI